MSHPKPARPLALAEARAVVADPALCDRCPGLRQLAWAVLISARGQRAAMVQHRTRPPAPTGPEAA